MPKKDIYLITENIVNSTEKVFVRATIGEIYKRQYNGGFRRFNSELYDFGGKDRYPINAKIDGHPIYTISKFDGWLKEHNCA